MMLNTDDILRDLQETGDLGEVKFVVGCWKLRKCCFEGLDGLGGKEIRMLSTQTREVEQSRYMRES